MVFLMALRRMGRGDITTHGFRSSFRDWAEEWTHFQRTVCNAALAHTVRDKTEAPYRRTDLFEKRRDGIVRLTLRPAQCRDEHSPAPLPSASLSARNHQLCRLALPQILHELPGC